MRTVAISAFSAAERALMGKLMPKFLQWLQAGAPEAPSTTSTIPSTSEPPSSSPASSLPASSPPSEPSSVKKKGYMCDSCPYTSKRLPDLREHILVEHQGQQPKCKQCTQTFKSKRALVKHVKRCHQKQFPYNCDEHNVHTFDIEEYQNHLIIKHNAKGKLPKCKSCGKQFTTRRIRDQHEATCGQNPAYRCPHCNKLFRRERGLRVHEVTHSENPTRYQCEHCDCSYNYRENLNSHIRRQHPDKL